MLAALTRLDDATDGQLAEAAFLVLARKADAVRPRDQMAVWLHRVAYCLEGPRHAHLPPPP